MKWNMTQLIIAFVTFFCMLLVAMTMMICYVRDHSGDMYVYEDTAAAIADVTQGDGV